MHRYIFYHPNFTYGPISEIPRVYRNFKIFLQVKFMSILTNQNSLFDYNIFAADMSKISLYHGMNE